MHETLTAPGKRRGDPVEPGPSPVPVPTPPTLAPPTPDPGSGSSKAAEMEGSPESGEEMEGIL